MSLGHLWITKMALFDTASKPFSAKQVDDGIFLCREIFYDSINQPNIWVVQGTSCDLVIDTGLGIWDLPKFLRENHLIGQKPVDAVATHIHFDHCGGLYQFESTAIHEAAANAIKHGIQTETLAYVLNSQIKHRPYKGWKASKYIVKAVQPTRILQEGDVFDLGNRKLKVIHLPGHSPGSIGLIDEDAKLLFCGDAVCDSGMGNPCDFIDWLPHSNVDKYMATCKRLKQLASSREVVKVFPGHKEIFDGKKLYEQVSDYIAQAPTVSRKLLRCCARPLLSAFVYLKHGHLAASCGLPLLIFGFICVAVFWLKLN